MARLINTGTVAVENGSTAVTGTNTPFDTQNARTGDLIVFLASAGAQWNLVDGDPASDTALTLQWAYEGATESGLEYFVVRLNAIDLVGVAYQKLEEVASALAANAALQGISIAAFVSDVAGLAAHDDEIAGFSAFVFDAGGGRSAIYFMGGGGSGDWRGPAYTTGGVGPQGEPGQATTYSGQGVPSAGLGADGETYLDLDTGDIYKKASGTWSFIANLSGHDADFSFVFSTVTTMADPTAGRLRFNHAAPGSVTAIALDDLTSDGTDLSAWVATWGSANNPVKGTLIVRKHYAREVFAIYSITAVADNSGWSQLSVTHVASSGSFANNDDLHVAYMRSGDNGNVLHNGTAAPASGLGVNGDYFLDTANLVLYGPKAAGAWPAGTSIVAVEYLYNLDGGHADSVYGGTTPIDGGAAAG